MAVLHGAQRLVAGAGASVEQGWQDRDRQRAAARALDHLAGADHAIQAVQGQGLGLGGNDETVGCGQRIDHQQAWVASQSQAWPEGRRLALRRSSVASADCAQT